MIREEFVPFLLGCKGRSGWKTDTRRRCCGGRFERGVDSGSVPEWGVNPAGSTPEDGTTEGVGYDGRKGAGNRGLRYTEV